MSTPETVPPETIPPVAAPVPPVVPPVPPVTPPVTPPVQEAVVPPVVPAPISTGNEFYDSTATILQEQGIDPLATIEAVRSNDGKLTPELREQLSGKLGAAYTTVLEKGLEGQVQAERADRTAVVDSVGGEEAWKSISEWTTTEANTLSKTDIAMYNDMLSKGGQQAQLAASKIKEAYMADPNTNVPAQNLLNGNSPVPPASAVEPVSRAVYLKEVKEARNMGDGAKIQSLEARARYTMEHNPRAWRPSRIG